MTLRERLLRRDRKIGAELGPMQPWHSTAYHRHFSGYEERRVVDADGRRRIQRVYTANLYALDLPGSRAVGLCLARLLLCLAAAGISIAAGVVPAASNSAWYVNLFQAASLPLMLWALYGAASACTAVTGMKVGAYRAARAALRYGAGCAAVAVGAAGIATAVCMLVGAQDGPDWRIPLMYLTAAAALVAVARIERCVRYREIPSETETGAHGSLM